MTFSRVSPSISRARTNVESPSELRICFASHWNCSYCAGSSGRRYVEVLICTAPIFFRRRHTATRSVLRFVGRLNSSKSHEVAVIRAHADQMKDVLQILFELTSSLLCLKRLHTITMEGVMIKDFVFRTTILLGIISNAFAANLNTARIDELTGLKGKMNEKEGVCKVTFPRNDVKVVVDGWTMPPFMGLGTWAAFTPTRDGAMVMGDTVLFEDEVNAAMSAALDNGLNVTALHNHFFFDHPKVYFMHIEGEGTVEKLAAAVRKVYDTAKQIRAASPNPKDSFGAAP